MAEDKIDQGVPLAVLDQLAEPFPYEDLEWRANRKGWGTRGPWVMVVPYFTSRAGMDRMDAALGPHNWQDQYVSSDGVLICRLGIRVAGMDWVWKSDGTGHMESSRGMSTSDAGKADCSNAFKRAAVKWGMGRYLYRLPEMWATTYTEKRKGASYEKIEKSKGNDVPVWWEPPAAEDMPAWALPEGSGNTGSADDLRKRYHAVVGKILEDLEAKERERYRKAFQSAHPNLPDSSRDWTAVHYRAAIDTLDGHGLTAFTRALEVAGNSDD